MNVRVDVSSGGADSVALPLPPQRALAQASIVPIAESVSAVVFDEAVVTAERRPRLEAFIDGRPAGRPVISTSLPLRSGGQRHCHIVGRDAAFLASRRVTILLGGAPAAQIDPAWLQSPLVEGSALTEGLSDDGRRRLLKLFLTTGASLFGACGASEFGRAARRLLDLLGVRPVEPAAWCPIGRAGGILSYSMPGDSDAAGITALVALADGRVSRLAGFRLASERARDRTALHVYLPRALPPGCSVVGLGPTPVHLLAPGEGLDARPLLSWLRKRDPQTARWAQELVGALSGADPVAAALTREIRHDGREPPGLEVRHLSATPEGILYSLELRDPHDLVRAVRIERGDAALELEPPAGARGTLAAHDLAGYAALARQSPAAESCRLRLAYRSGRIRTVRDGVLEAYRGEPPRGFAAAPSSAAAVARARFDLDAPPRSCVVEDFAPPITVPKLSIVAGISDNLDLVRARAAMVFGEPRRGRVELVYHVADGALAAAAGRAVADAAAVFAIPHRLVVLRRDADMGGRFLAALEQARGERLLAMGADVLPAGPGWLAAWLRRIGAARPMLGGALLDHSGAVLHAGADPARGPGGAAQRPGRFEGLPAADLPRRPAMPTARVSAECVGLTRAAADLVLACRRYPDPDIMLAEAAGRLRQEGRKISTLLACRFVRYAERRAHPLDVAAEAEALRLTLNASFAAAGEKASA